MTYKPFTILIASWHRYHRLKRRVLRMGGKILGRKIYGPMSVYHSLIRWLDEIKNKGELINYNINPSKKDIHETVIVLMGKDTLHYALDLKKQWIIKTILAWPAISVPINHSDLFFHPDIDTILVPSVWVKNYFSSLAVYHPERIQVRPAWVADTGSSKKVKQHILIYKKNCPESLYTTIIDMLDKQSIEHTTLHYGHFQFWEYQQFLNESIAMIYLQESESQWIALQEAWIKDIPTLVRDRGYRSYAGETKRTEQQISCPFLTPACGLTFTEENSTEQFDIFMQNIYSYTPRSYCLAHLSDTVSATILLSYL